MRKPFYPTHAIVFNGGEAEDAQEIIALFNNEDECSQAFDAIDDGNYYEVELTAPSHLSQFVATFNKP